MCFVSTDLSSFSLSPQDKFFSKLTDSGISDEDYQHALNVWNTFQCQDLGKQSKVHFFLFKQLLVQCWCWHECCLQFWDLWSFFFWQTLLLMYFPYFLFSFFFLFFLGMYHDIYLESDVYLLADVFEHFRTTALSTYGLDPAHYLSLPGFSWDALLKQTNVSLDLLSDVDMHLFVEKGNCLVLAIHV